MTPTLRNENDDRARLEFYPINSSVLRTVVIEDYPFAIGRGDHTDLKIDSTSVSREHASLMKTPDGIRLEDLGSTNGTEVNGELIANVPLEDGDAIRIAELEITFRQPVARPGDADRIATQPLAGSKKLGRNARERDVLSNQRLLSEALLWQAIPLQRSVVMDSQSDDHVAVFASIGESFGIQLRASTCSDPCGTASRVQQLAWMVAARRANELAGDDILFLRFDLHSGLDQRICNDFQAAVECLRGDQPLGVLFHWDWAVQSPETIALCRQLKASGAVLALDSFSGGAACIESIEDAAPDLLVLDPTVTRSISSNSRGKKHLDRLVARCEKSDTRVVMPAGLTEDDYQVVQGLGVELIVRKSNGRDNAANGAPVAITV